MENKHTLEDLQRLQELPFERKILITQTRIMEWYYRNNGRVVVSYSGGKDSSVLLYLVRQQFPEVPAVFVNTGLEYPEVVERVKATENVTVIRPKMSFRAVIEKCGYPVISKDVALTIAGYRRGAQWAIERLTGMTREGEKHKFRDTLYRGWRFLIDAPFLISDDCCDIMKELPLMRYNKAGELKQIVGTLASESRRRQDAWLKVGCNAFEGKRARSAPLSFWLEQDVLRFIYEYKIPIPSVYGSILKTENGYRNTGVERTGCMFCLFGCHLEDEPNRIQRMARTHPKQYEYCLRDFDKGGLGLREVMDYLGIPYEI